MTDRRMHGMIKRRIHPIDAFEFGSLAVLSVI
jgi:hypothetical protein